MDTLDGSLLALGDDPKVRAAAGALASRPGAASLGALLSALARSGEQARCASVERVFAVEHPEASLQTALAHWSKKDAGVLSAAGLALQVSPDTAHGGVRIEVVDKKGAAAVAKLSGDALGRVTALRFASETGRGVLSKLLQSKKLVRLVELDDDAGKVGGAGIKALAAHATLEVLRLDDSGIDLKGLAALEALPALRTLRVAGESFGDAGVAAIARLVGLRSLSLAACDLGPGAGAALKPMTGLEVLHLGGEPIGPKGASALAALDNLAELGLSNCGIKDAGAQAISAITGLRMLHVGASTSAGMGKAGVRAIAGLRQLRVLNLSGNEVADKDLVPLGALGNLQDVSLYGTDAAGLTLKALATGAAGLRALRVSLQGPAAPLTKVIGGMKALERIDLQHTRLDARALDNLAGSKGLRWLRIDGAHCGPDGAVAVAPPQAEVRPFRPAAGHDDFHSLLIVAFKRLPDRLVVHLIGDYDAGAAVLNEETIVRGLEQGVDRDRDRSYPHRGEERRGERRRVVQHQEHPVLPIHAQLSQRMAEPVDPACELPVGDLLVA
ncbi:MAG: hypothetical protein WKG00_38460, partial [Polyangiaceae bacterium]